MAATLQPLDKQFPVVGPDGRPTEYFIRWAQQRQLDIQGGVTPDQVNQFIEEWSKSRNVLAGDGLAGGGSLDEDVTISLAAGLDDLTDVDLSSAAPTDGQVLVYDEPNSLWIPADQSGGGGATGEFKGPWVAPSPPGVLKFDTQTVPTAYNFRKAGQYQTNFGFVSAPDAVAGTTYALTFPGTIPMTGGSWTGFGMTVQGTATNNVFKFRAWVQAETGYDGMVAYKNGARVIWETGVQTGYKEYTITLNGPGVDVNIEIGFFQDGVGAEGFENARISYIEVPTDEPLGDFYTYGDTVFHDGSFWFCALTGTTSTPGTNNEWIQFSASGGGGGGDGGATNQIAMKLIGSYSASSNVIDTGVLNLAPYSRVLVVLEDVRMGSTTDLLFRLKSGGTPISSGIYDWVMSASSNGAATSNSSATASTSISLNGTTYDQNPTAEDAYWGSIELYGADSATSHKRIMWLLGAAYGSGNNGAWRGEAAAETMSVIDGITILPVTGTLTGTIKVYGFLKTPELVGGTIISEDASFLGSVDLTLGSDYTVSTGAWRQPTNWTVNNDTLGAYNAGAIVVPAAANYCRVSVKAVWDNGGSTRAVRVSKADESQVLYLDVRGGSFETASVGISPITPVTPGDSFILTLNSFSSPGVLKATGYGAPTRLRVEWYTNYPGAGNTRGETLLGTYNLAGLSQKALTSLIGSTYKTYRLELADVAISTTDYYVGLQVSTDNGATWQGGTGYDTALWQANQAAYSSTISSGGSTSDWRLGWTLQAGTDAGASIDAKLFNPHSTTTFKSMQVSQAGMASDGNFYMRTGGGRWKSNSAYNAIRIMTSNSTGSPVGTFTSGTLRIWGS